MIVFVVLLIVAVFLALFLYLRHLHYVVIPSQIEAPHITPDAPNPLWGSVSSLNARTGTLDHYLQVHRAHLQNPAANVARLHVLFMAGVVLFDPKHGKRVMITENFPKSFFYDSFTDLLGDGLVASSGEKWETHRKLLNPAFGPLYLKNLLPAFVEHTQVLLDKLDKKENTFDDLGEELQKLAMDIIARTGFGYNLRSTEGKAPPVEKAFSLMLKLLSEPLILLVAPLRKITKFRYRAEANLIKKVIFDSIEEKQRRQKDTSKPDILDLLLTPSSDPNSTEKLLTKEEIRDELVTFFVAGHETTALTLSWALYLLHHNPSVMEKLVSEVDEILLDQSTSQPRAPKVEDLPRFKYLTMVLKETLRLYPPAAGVTRKTPEDVEFDGHKVAKGITVFLPIYTWHRDPSLWNDPDVFDPERWNDDNVNASSANFFAFSHGPRNCIGQQFFWNEAKVILSMLLAHFKVVIDNKEEVIATDKTGTLKPATPIKVRFIKR